MAKARMLHGKISLSTQVNRLSLPARLLFTWMIPHADCEGRLKGDPECVKATVVPMTNWSFGRIKGYLEEMVNVGLIYYWLQSNEWFVEFVNWKRYQHIRKDRFIPSDLPSSKDGKGNQSATSSQPDGNQKATQSNINEYSLREYKKSEEREDISIADKNSSNGLTKIINSKDFEPQSEGETVAKDIWEQLEPYNPLALQTTYIWAIKQGVPVQKMYEFASEIKQDAINIRNKGAVFRKKVEGYLALKTQNF